MEKKLLSIFSIIIVFLFVISIPTLADELTDETIGFHRPRKIMTRTELANFLVTELELDTGDVVSNCSESGDYLVDIAISKGIVSCYEDGEFHGELVVKRSDAAKITYNAYDLDSSAAPEEAFFDDVDNSHDDFYYIQTLVDNNIIKVNEGNFNPNDLITLNTMKSWTSEEDYLVNEKKDAINYAIDNNIMQGFSDGYFRSGQSITRAEFTKVLIGSHFSEETINSCTEQVFPDITGDMYDKFGKFICVAKKNNVVDGDRSGNFLPNDYINTMQAAKIILNTLGYDITKDPNNWRKPYLEKLETLNAIPPMIQHEEHFITRGETMVIIRRLKENITNLESITYSKLHSKYSFETKPEIVTRVGNSKIDLIIGLAVPNLDNNSEYEVIISNAQDKFLDALEGSNYTLNGKLTNMPVISVNVDRSTMESIEEYDRVQYMQIGILESEIE